ncbi:MAG: tetratricopeptide repeat protein [Methylophilaceae bacterium]
MSLLIKALDKAQAQKAQVKGGADSKVAQKPSNPTASAAEAPVAADKKTSLDDLSLSPADETLSTNTQIKNEIDDTPAVLKGSAADIAQKEPQRTSETKSSSSAPLSIAPVAQTSRAQAANVFSAKQAEPSSHIAKIAVIIALLAIALLAGFAYWYQFAFNQPAIVIPPRPSMAEVMPQAMPDAKMQEEMDVQIVDDLAQLEDANNADTFIVQDLPATNTGKSDSDNKEEKSVFDQPSFQSAAVKETLTSNEKVITASEAKVALISDQSASENASIEITKAKTESGINQVLMRAYEAYNQGNDNQAQADYKLVLKQYGANVDAMLGLGAIATREGRVSDADGWYRKVLELEPRNDVAKSGLISIQQSVRPQVNESQIKSMIATSPTDANLHAALGDVYASQNSWPAAQQAYFEAYRLNPTAENAFNLGISLDQLGKPNIALPYYQEALQKAGQSSLIDTAALEARISSIQ